MTRLLAISLVCTAVLPAAPAQDKKTPPPAAVTLTGTVSGMSRIDEKKVELRLDGPLAKGQSILTAPHVLVDEAAGKVDPLSRKLVAFEGRLSTKDVVVGQTGSVPAKKITAKALYLVADKATEVSDDNKASLPAKGLARVRGKLVQTEAKGGGTAWAVENAELPIALTGKALPESAKAGQTVTAAGRLRVAEGALVLEVETVEVGEQ
jgi:hypothetical protein